MIQMYEIVIVFEKRGRRREMKACRQDGPRVADACCRGIIERRAGDLSFITAYKIPVPGSAGSVDLMAGKQRKT